MTPAALDLARRLVAAPQWEWRVGMAVVELDDPARWRAVHVAGDTVLVTGPNGWTAPTRWRAVHVAGDTVLVAGPNGWTAPLFDNRIAAETLDLTDPATAGILLAMLAEPDEVDVQVYSYPGGYTQGWRVVTHTYAGDQLGGYLEREYEAPTLGEAVAKALLEVWGE